MFRDQLNSDLNGLPHCKPRILRQSWRSLGIRVTRFAWCVMMFASSMTWVTRHSVASCITLMASAENRMLGSTSMAKCFTIRWKGSLGTSVKVDCWYFVISARTLSPGLQRGIWEICTLAGVVESATTVLRALSPAVSLVFCFLSLRWTKALPMDRFPPALVTPFLLPVEALPVTSLVVFVTCADIDS